MLRGSSLLLLTAVLGSAAFVAACAHGGAPPSAPTPGAAGAPRSVAGHDDGPAPSIRRLPGAREGSAVLLAELDGRTVAYVADEDDAMVRVVDVEEGRELSQARVGGAPSQVVMLPDGRLVATLRDAARVVVLRGGGTSRSRLVVDKRIDVAPEPIGLALSPDDAKLVVTSGWGRTVSVVDVASLERRSEVLVAREPRAVVVSKDGRRAYVAHAVGQGLDVVPLDGAPAEKPRDLSGIEQIEGRHMFMSEVKRAACQGFALAKADSGRVFAPHVLVFAGDTSEVSSGYGGGGTDAEVFHVPVIDEDSGKVVAESMRLRAGMEPTTTKCVLPRAAAVGKAGLFVTCLGQNTVSLFDADAVNPQDVDLATWSVPAGPTGVALDDAHDRAVVWSQFAHALTTIAIKAPDGASRPFALSSVTLPRTTRTSAKVERGRMLFHATTDERISSDGRACASCHPDGRDDALVWSSPKGPRQTPMLAGRLDGAAPFGWNGDANDVSTHLVATFKRLGGKGLTGEDKEALLAYVAAMRPPPAPAARDDGAIPRGRAIFRSDATGCASCHGASGDMPDGAQHDVKSRARADASAKFDTPSLRFVSGSAPYFHDGRYADLHSLLVKSDGKMGHTKHLSPSELADLEAYLGSL